MRAFDALGVEQDVGLIYRQMGPLREGLEGIEKARLRPAELLGDPVSGWTQQELDLLGILQYAICVPCAHGNDSIPALVWLRFGANGQ